MIFTESCVADFRIVVMARVMWMKIVGHALVTAGRARLHLLLQRIVEMVHAMEEKVVPPVQVIVVHALRLLHLLIVEMECAITVKIVDPVQMIVLEPIHVITAPLQTGKHPLG